MTEPEEEMEWPDVEGAWTNKHQLSAFMKNEEGERNHLKVTNRDGKRRVHETLAHREEALGL